MHAFFLIISSGEVSKFRLNQLKSNYQGNSFLPDKMSKRRTESTSSSSSTESEDYSTDTNSIDASIFTLGSSRQTKTKNSQQAPSANGRKSSVGLKRKGQTPVASTSAQLQSDFGNVVKTEIEEMDVDHNELTDSAPKRIAVDCSTSAVGEEAQVRMSKPQRVSVKVVGSKDPKRKPQQPPSKQPSKKVGVSNPHEKYFEGCLVMAWGPNCRNGDSYWPGIIRRAGPDHPTHHNYYRNSPDRIWFFIQFFTNPTTTGWRIPGNMRLFNAAKPNLCNFPNPTVVADFGKGIRIAKAALNFWVKDRLAKFTLHRNTSTTSLLKAIDDWNSQSKSGNDTVAQLENNITQGNGKQDGGNPVASTSKQPPHERVTTVKEKVEHTTVNRDCSSPKIASNGPTVSEQRERNGGISTSTQLHHEVEVILIDESDVEVENTEVGQSPPQRMDVPCSTSAAAKKSTPSVQRSKRKRDSSNELTSEVHDMTHSSAERPEMSRVASASTEVQIKFEAIANDEIEDNEEVVVSDSNAMNRACSPGQLSLPSVRRSKRVSTMISKEIEKYFEGCLVMILLDGFPVSSGMIRKPDVDPLNHPHVNTDHDEYICEENGAFYFYVQIFEEPTTLKWFTISNLELFDPALEPAVWWEPDPYVMVNFKIGVKTAIAASKYSVEERLRKFTLPIGTSVRSLFREIQNKNSQPTTYATTPKPRTLPTESTAQGTHGNGRKCPDSVEIRKRGISEYQQKLRDECNREKDEEIKRLTTVKEKPQNDTAPLARDEDASFSKVKNRVVNTQRKLRETEQANRCLTTENLNLEEKISDLKRQLNSNSFACTKVIILEKNLKQKDSAMKAQEKYIFDLRTEVLELQGNLKIEIEEKRECQEKLEKMRSEFQKLEELFEDGT